MNKRDYLLAKSNKYNSLLKNNAKVIDFHKEPSYKTSQSIGRPFYLVEDKKHPREGYWVNYQNKNNTHDIHYVDHSGIKPVKLNSKNALDGHRLEEYQVHDYVINPSILSNIFENAPPAKTGNIISLKKSAKHPKKIIWNVKIKGEPNWHGVVDMVDLGGGDKGNNYILADGRQVHQTLIEDIDFEPNKKLEKGAMKKFPFNPKKDISKKDYQKIRQWAEVGVGQDRSDILPLTGNARQRMLHKLSGMTKVKKNDKGERLFLLHRGVSNREMESHASGSHTNYKDSGLSTNSWTPDHSTALKFSNDPNGERVISAWIHEKDISNMPLMHWDISKRLKNEKEVIVNHTMPHKIIQDKNKAFKLALPYSKYGNETRITTAGPDGYNVHEDAADINYKINQRNLQKADDNYRGHHQAPGPDDTPMHDLHQNGNGAYPEDIYSHMAQQYYGHGVPYDRESISVMQSARGNPDHKVKIYRAVPHTKSNADKIAELTEHKKYILKYGKLPPKAKANMHHSDYYDWADNEINRLQSDLEAPAQKAGINSGDWVTTSRSYAKDHGESHLKGEYKIISKIVPAGHLHTDGNSIHEWGYNPPHILNKADDINSHIKANHNKFPVAGTHVDGRAVRKEVPNIESIGATFNNWHELPGIREVSLSHFHPEYNPNLAQPETVKRSKQLAEEIKQSNEISPLIVAIDKEGPYILEGGHRFDAMHHLGAKSFPAKVVLDLDSFKGDILKKGAKGDWQKEGYKLKHRIAPGDEHVITAHTPDGDSVGFYTFATQPSGLVVSGAETHPDHQRKGLANAAYKLVEQKSGLKIIHQKELQSGDAKKLWSQPNRPFGKSVQLLKKSLDQMERIACVVVSKGDQVLMGLRKDNNRLTFPGGHLDAGEDPKQGAKRELLEEAGIHADDLSFLGEQMKVGQDGKIRKIYVFALLGYKPLVTNKFDPDGEFSKMFWVNVKNGLPKTVENNLHVPRPHNLALELLGL